MASEQPLRRIRTLIGQAPALAVLLPEAERLRRLNLRLARVLPGALAGACRVVAAAGGEARIWCDNGTAASRLRSLTGTVTKALTTDACPVDRLRVRVQAEWRRPERLEKPGLGPEAIKAWKALEHDLPDGGLKRAVDRLLGHHRKS